MNIQLFKKLAFKYAFIEYLINLRKSKNYPDAIFIWIPKAAGTTIYESLGKPPKFKSPTDLLFKNPNKGLITATHLDYAKAVRKGYIDSDFFEKANKFAFVRNPYERAISLYEYHRKMGFINDKLTFEGFLSWLFHHPPNDIGLRIRYGLSLCNPQTRWLENIQLDFLGRVENFDADIQKLAADSGIQINWKGIKNQSERADFWTYYNQTTIKLVNAIYKEDFDNFGYTILNEDE
jgi:hypothetical protein